VVLNKTGCQSRYVAETPNGYVILEWYGGNDPMEGDTIKGDIESYGMTDFYNVTTGSSGKVWVEDYMMSKSSALEKMENFCS